MIEPHRILVVDDDPVVRAAYRSFFSGPAQSGSTPSGPPQSGPPQSGPAQSGQHEFVWCGEARDGAEGVAAYQTLRPDLVLMDLQLPVLSGTDATRQICRRWPGACVVAMTTFGTGDYVVAALRAGAAGYLLKDVGGAGLLVGLRQALAGEMPLSAAVRRELVASMVEERPPAAGHASGPEVSPRERELLSWLAQGLTNHQIGSQMHVSEGSVKQYFGQLGRKLGVTSRTGILVRAIQLGLVDPHALPPLGD